MIKHDVLPHSWYRKLTCESAHAWNLIILYTFIALGMTTKIIVHLIFYVFSLSIYDVIYHITTTPGGTLLKSCLQLSAYDVNSAEVIYKLTQSLISSLIL